MAKLNFAYAIIFYLLFPAFLNAQPSDDWIKENFVVEVHTVDDFIERFNGDVDQRVRDQWFKLLIKDISRKDILYSLFNLRSADWSEAQVETFINQAIDRECPAFLDFEGDEWYAKVNCKVQFQGKNYLTDLVLKVRKDPASGGLEWVIVSMLHSGFSPSFARSPFHTPRPTGSCSSAP